MNKVQTIHKHRCARCGDAWSHVADGKVHAHTCSDGVTAIGCSVRAPSMSGSLGAGVVQPPSGGRTGGIVDVVTDGIRDGLETIGGITDGLMRPISDLIRFVDTLDRGARFLVLAGAAGYIYVKTRPQRVTIVSPRGVSASTRPGRARRRSRR